MIEPLSLEEYEAVPQALRRGRQPSAETLAIRALNPMMGLKMPCRGGHKANKTQGCRVRELAHQTASRQGFRITTKCHEGMVYIFRHK